MIWKCLDVLQGWTYQLHKVTFGDPFCIRFIGTCFCLLALWTTCPAQTDTMRLGMERVAGVAVRLPLDTLVVGNRKIVGVAVPARVRQVPGDINADGNVTLADVMTLAYHVLMARSLPGGDTVCIPIERTDTLGVTTLFNFLPRRPGVR